MNIIISNEKQDYTEFIAKALNEFEHHEVKGIAIVALCEDENLTGYWNMNLYNKLTAENEIRFDTFDEFLRVNQDRYFGDEEGAE